MRYVATVLMLMVSSAAMSAPQPRTITTSLPANRPVGAEASAFVRSVKAGAVPEHSDYKDHDLLLVGNLLELQSGKQVDIAILASANQKERLKAFIQHDPRLVTGKLTSIACRRVDGRGPVVVVSNCRFAASA